MTPSVGRAFARPSGNEIASSQYACAEDKAKIMRAPKRKRPMRRTRFDPPDGTDLADLAETARYVGSAEHKSYPSFAGPPKLRSDASRCDPELADQQALSEWLRAGIVTGDIGAPWEGRYPRYVWYRREGTYYEGRLVNSELGEYKGYPLTAAEIPDL